MFLLFDWTSTLPGRRTNERDRLLCLTFVSSPETMRISNRKMMTHDKKCSNKCFHFSWLPIIYLDVDRSQQRDLLLCKDYNEYTSAFLSLSLVVDLRRRNSRRPGDLGLVPPLRELWIDLFARYATRKNKRRSFLISMMMSLVKRHRWSTNASRSASETTENTSLPTNSSTDESQSEFSNHPSRPVRHLFLIRHGQYQRRRTQSDGHLTAKGQKQAWYTANFLLSQLPDDVLFDSLTHSDSKETFDQCWSCSIDRSSDSNAWNSDDYLSAIEIDEENRSGLFLHRYWFSWTEPSRQLSSRRELACVETRLLPLA